MLFIMSLKYRVAGILLLFIALHHAVQANNNLSMKVLVESGAQLHLVNKDVSIISIFGV